MRTTAILWALLVAFASIGVAQGVNASGAAGSTSCPAGTVWVSSQQKCSTISGSSQGIDVSVAGVAIGVSGKAFSDGTGRAVPGAGIGISGGGSVGLGVGGSAVATDGKNRLSNSGSAPTSLLSNDIGAGSSNTGSSSAASKPTFTYALSSEAGPLSLDSPSPTPQPTPPVNTVPQTPPYTPPPTSGTDSSVVTISRQSQIPSTVTTSTFQTSGSSADPPVSNSPTSTPPATTPAQPSYADANLVQPSTVSSTTSVSTPSVNVSSSQTVSTPSYLLLKVPDPVQQQDNYRRSILDQVQKSLQSLGISAYVTSDGQGLSFLSSYVSGFSPSFYNSAPSYSTPSSVYTSPYGVGASGSSRVSSGGPGQNAVAVGQNVAVSNSGF